MKYFCILFIILNLCTAVEYPYYVETTDGAYTWSAPALLPAISAAKFWWTELDCEVINNRPFAVHNDLDGVMQLFYPDPDDPGNPGDWNWQMINVTEVGSHYTNAGTTWTMVPIMYPNVSFLETGPYGVILISYKCNFVINPPPPGWTDGNYLGGILSIDGGNNWHPCRPLSGPLLQAVGGPIEVAHRLIGALPPDPLYCYSTWTDTDDGVIGNQYFELGIVRPLIGIWHYDSPKLSLTVNDRKIAKRSPSVSEFFPRRELISPVGDSRSILGPAGKNICVAADGATIALMYGAPSDPYDPIEPFGGVYIAYSTDTGTTWNHYGPFNLVAPLRRIYPSVDGCENFHSEPNNLFFAWQEGPQGYDPNHSYIMFEENIPSVPSFSSPIQIPNNVYPWMPCVGVNPDDNWNIMITAWSSLAFGDNANYAWISTDGGWTWSNNITVTPPVNTDIVSAGAGHFRWGTGNYAFFTYHDEYDPAVEEHDIDPISDRRLEVLPTIANRFCHISFTAPQREKINLKLYDVSGRLVETAFDGYLNRGAQSINLDISELPNGIYVVLLKSPSVKQKTKFIKMK